MAQTLAASGGARVIQQPVPLVGRPDQTPDAVFVLRWGTCLPRQQFIESSEWMATMGPSQPSHKEHTMKKLTLLLACLALAGAAAAQVTGGGFTGNASATAATAPAPRGGFTGPMTVVTAAQAKALPDDAKITLRGTIESHLGGKNYLFKDASGTIPLEIKSKRWDAQSISPQDTVQIDGEVERKRDAVSVEVKLLRKL